MLKGERKTQYSSKKIKKQGLMIVIIVILAIILTALVIMKLTNYTIANLIEDKKLREEQIIANQAMSELEDEPSKSIEVERKVGIYNGVTRPICVMIDNEPGAYPQAGMQEASIIYECIVEGGQTRFMVLFKDASTTKVGPIRSSRHYFVRFAMEYGAIYAHFGWSPQAQNIITQNGVNNINGMYYDGGKYWREGSGYHTSFTNIENLLTIAKNLNYITVGSNKAQYNYSTENIELEQGKQLKSVKLTYSAYHTVEYKYNEEQKVFLRYQRGEAHTDRDTLQQLYAKNVIVMYAKNYNIGDGSARQEVENVGKGTGHYITNGKYIDINWSKKSIKAKTYFYDKSGNEITLNDGITFIQVVPIQNEAIFIT